MPKTGNFFPAQLHYINKAVKKSTISLVFLHAVYWHVYLNKENRFFIGYWTKIEAGFLSGLSLHINHFRLKNKKYRYQLGCNSYEHLLPRWMKKGN
jgi:hypothetical protein